MFAAIHIDLEASHEASAAIVRGAFSDIEAVAGDRPEAGSLEQAARRRPHFTGKLENLVEVSEATDAGASAEPRTLFLVGLGARASFTVERLRKAIAHLGRRLAETHVETVRFELTDALSGTNVDVSGAARAVGETLGLLSWDGGILRGQGTERRDQPSLTVLSSDSEFRAGLDIGLRLAASANIARTISQTPPNVATPLWIADRAAEVAREAGLELRVLQGAELEQERLAGLITVGKASDNPPCLIRLEYRPAGTAAYARPLVLIGKTITYDTGGLSLKINNGMVGMKRDKDGGCAVLGAMHAIGTVIRPSFPIVGLLVAAENSVSMGAMRPDDVITYRNGVTVEITNTDAEGRLVLADALCWACEVERAAAIVDLATLTGGVVTALGSTYAGLFCEDDRLRADLERASGASGERIWRLPMHDEYREMMKSPVADLVNSNPNRKAHPIQGAAFLSYFVAADTPWAHIDIAGVHAVDADSGAFIKGPTGFGARLLAELAEGWGERE